jgi:hypothetical protein
VGGVVATSYTVFGPRNVAGQRQAPSSPCPCYGGDMLNANLRRVAWLTGALVVGMFAHVHTCSRTRHYILHADTNKLLYYGRSVIHFPHNMLIILNIVD